MWLRDGTFTSPRNIRFELIEYLKTEHKKNLQTDGWRLHELEKSLTNPSHPYSKFGTGNLSTLKYNPEKLGLNIREELLRFHDTYYSSNIMKLCVLGKGKKSNYKWTDGRRVWREHKQN